MSHGIERVSKKKLELYKKSIKQGSTTKDIMRYKDYRNHYNKLKRTTRVTYYVNKVAECKNRSKELWKVINRVIEKVKHTGIIISHIAIDGLKAYNPKKIVNEFGRFYSSLGKKLASKIVTGNTNIDIYLSKILQIDASLTLNLITQLEVESIIKELPNKASHGHDNISNTLLKQLCPSISFPPYAIFNQSLATGKFPEVMKKAEIIPLYKGKEFDMVVNYRSVSLLLTISKVLEKEVYKRVYKFLEKHNVLYDNQYGFRNRRSCEQAVMELLGKVLRAKYQGKHSSAIFLDLSKAFDTLDHKILLRKPDLYSLRGLCKERFKDYLKNRTLVTKILTINNRNVKSEVFNITHGTVQGSCLGPLLFIIFCNDIQLLPTYSKILLFKY